MLKIAICDDLEADRASLRRFLAARLACCDHEITEYACAQPLLADYEEESADFDLLFLDIFMEGMDGMAAARAIRRHDANVPVVFLTTTPDYALAGYDVRALGYLVKPLDAKKAAAMLDWFLRTVFLGGGSILLREGVRGRRLSCREILYIESRNTLALVHTNEQIHRLYRKLDELETELQGRGFLRCHKSYLVNLARVRAVEKTSFLMEGGDCVPLRQRDARALRDAYFEYLLAQAAMTRL